MRKEGGDVNTGGGEGGGGGAGNRVGLKITNLLVGTGIDRI